MNIGLNARPASAPQARRAGISVASPPQTTKLRPGATSSAPVYGTNEQMESELRNSGGARPLARPTFRLAAFPLSRFPLFLRINPASYHPLPLCHVPGEYNRNFFGLSKRQAIWRVTPCAPPLSNNTFGYQRTAPHLATNSEPRPFPVGNVFHILPLTRQARGQIPGQRVLQCGKSQGVAKNSTNSACGPRIFSCITLRFMDIIRLHKPHFRQEWDTSRNYEGATLLSSNVDGCLCRSWAAHGGHSTTRISR